MSRPPLPIRHADHPLARALDPRDMRPNTLRVYRRAVESFLVFCRGRDPTWTILESWLDSGKTSPQSANVRLSAIKYASRWASLRYKQETAAYGDFATASKIRLVFDTTTRMPSTFAAMERVIAACADGSPQGVQDAAILTLATRQGARCITIASANVEFFDPHGGQLQRTTLKGGKLFTIPLDAETTNAIAAWVAWLRQLDMEHTDGPLFRTFVRNPRTGVYRLSRRRITEAGIRSRLTKRCALAGIARLTPHQLRHGFVTTARLAGYNDWQISAVTGHKRVLDQGGRVSAPQLGTYTHSGSLTLPSMSR